MFFYISSSVNNNVFFSDPDISGSQSYGPDDDCYMPCSDIPHAERRLNQQKKHWKGCPKENDGRVKSTSSTTTMSPTTSVYPEHQPRTMGVECEGNFDRNGKRRRKRSCNWCHRRGYAHYEPIDPCVPPNTNFTRSFPDDSYEWEEQEQQSSNSSSLESDEIGETGDPAVQSRNPMSDSNSYHDIDQEQESSTGHPLSQQNNVGDELEINPESEISSTAEKSKTNFQFSSSNYNEYIDENLDDRQYQDDSPSSSYYDSYNFYESSLDDTYQIPSVPKDSKSYIIYDYNNFFKTKSTYTGDSKMEGRFLSRSQDPDSYYRQNIAQDLWTSSETSLLNVNELQKTKDKEVEEDGFQDELDLDVDSRTSSTLIPSAYIFMSRTANSAVSSSATSPRVNSRRSLSCFVNAGRSYGVHSSSSFISFHHLVQHYYMYLLCFSSYLCWCCYFLGEGFINMDCFCYLEQLVLSATRYGKMVILLQLLLLMLLFSSCRYCVMNTISSQFMFHFRDHKEQIPHYRICTDLFQDNEVITRHVEDLIGAHTL